MRVLDRYLLRELLIPILLMSLTLVFLVLIADLFDNLDSMLKHHTSLPLIFKYYLTLTPFAFTQTLPWATLLGTLYVLVSFNFHNEIVAMKVSGLEITTIVRPIFFLGFLIGITNFLVSDRLVPETFRSANELREVHIEKKREKESGKIYTNVTYYSEGNQLQFYRFFNPEKSEVEDAILLWIDPATRKTQRKMVAKRGRWEEGAGWTFQNITEYEMDPQGRLLGEPKNFVSRAYGDLKTMPSDLRYAASESSFLSMKELRHYIKTLTDNGINPYSEKVTYQYRLAAPWQSLVMMLIAVPLLAPTRSRKIIAFNVLICLGVVFAFHVFGAISVALGKTGRLPPFVSAWLSTFLFGAAGLLYLERGNE